MKKLIAALALALAACGGGNDHAANNTGHDHDHFHSHSGETIDLGKGTLGSLTVLAFQKDKPKRGGESQFELKFTGGEVQSDRIQVQIVDADGKRVVWLGLHAMAEAGRFGAHAGLPADAPIGLKLRVSIKDAEPAQVAEFAIKE